MRGLQMCQVLLSYDHAVPVYKGVDWVQADILGESRYTFADFKEINMLEIEDRVKKIHNLSEAIGLFCVSGFEEKQDNKYVVVGDQTWELHKQGLEAVKYNCGCCVATSSWLCFILEKSYQKVGYIACCGKNGLGHVFNYIYHEQNYYFIDMLMYTDKYRPYLVHKFGEKKELLHLKFVTSICYRAQSVQDFLDYFRRRMILHEKEIAFILQSGRESLVPVSFQKESDCITLLLPEDADVYINTNRCNKIFIRKCNIHEMQIIS